MMNPQQTIGGILGLLVAICVGAASLRLGIGALHEPGPGFLFFWEGLLLAVCSAILLAACLFRQAGDESPADSGNGTDWRNAAVVGAALAVYCGILPKLGYRVSTFLLMTVLFGLGRMKPWAAALSALIAALLSDYLFGHLLRTPLPRGLWGF